MFDKTIKLTEPYPSDFEPTMSVMEIQKHFESHGFNTARMIAGSKSVYKSSKSKDLVIFNANVFMKDVGKVWFGDLNLTEDYKTLKKISDSLNTTLYILWEMDGRFGEENKSIDELISKAVWNTDEDKPTNEWYRKKVKENYE
jgi:hypothetical protein